MRYLQCLAVMALLGVGGVSPAAAAADTDRVTCFSLGNESYKDKSKFDSGYAACTHPPISDKIWCGHFVGYVPEAAPTSRRLHGKVDFNPAFTLRSKHLNLSETRALLR